MKYDQFGNIVFYTVYVFIEFVVQSFCETRFYVYFYNILFFAKYLYYTIITIGKYKGI